MASETENEKCGDVLPYKGEEYRCEKPKDHPEKECAASDPKHPGHYYTWPTGQGKKTQPSIAGDVTHPNVSAPIRTPNVPMDPRSIRPI